MAEWSALPDIILAEIFSYLPMLDRLTVGSVCTTWSLACQRPEAWQTFSFSESDLIVTLLGDILPNTPDDLQNILIKKEDFEMIELILNIIKDVGRYFRIVNICYNSGMSDQILECIAGNCRNITHLTIRRQKSHVQVIRNHDTFCDSAIKMILQNNTRLQSLQLRDLDHPSAVQQKDLLPFGAAHSSCLTHLSLIQAYQHSNLGSLMYLVNLKELAIEPHLLSYSLLHHLAGSSLKDLNVVAISKHMAMYNENLQNWQWREIKKKCPGFRVHCHFGIGHVWVEKEIILKEEMPVQSLKYTKYKLLNYEGLTSLVCKYADTLVELIDFSWSLDSYLETRPVIKICNCLLEVVNTCHNLRTVAVKEVVFSCVILAIFLRNKHVKLLLMEKQVEFDRLAPDLNLVGYTSQEMEILRNCCEDRQQFEHTVYTLTGTQWQFYTYEELTEIMFSQILKFF